MTREYYRALSPEERQADRVKAADQAWERIKRSRFGKIAGGLGPKHFEDHPPDGRPNHEAPQAKETLLRILHYAPRLILRNTMLNGEYLTQERNRMLVSSGVNLFQEISQNPFWAKQQKKSLNGSLLAGYRNHWEELRKYVDGQGRILESISQSNISYLRRLAGMSLKGKMFDTLKSSVRLVA